MRTTREKRKAARANEASTRDLRRQVRVLSDNFRELSRVVGGAARGRARSVQHAVEDEFDQGWRRLADVEEVVLDQVRDRPWRAVLIAAGIGALCGILVARR